MIYGPNVRPPISPGDPLRIPKLVAWRVLQDAVCKSCLTNDLQGNRVAGSKEMIGYLGESREWIMAMGENPVTTKIAGGKQAGFECGFCLDILELDRDAFVKYMRRLWDERDDKIMAKLKEKHNYHKSKSEESKRSKMRGGRPRGPQYTGGDTMKNIKRAKNAVWRSKKWGRHEREGGA